MSYGTKARTSGAGPSRVGGGAIAREKAGLEGGRGGPCGSRANGRRQDHPGLRTEKGGTRHEKVRASRVREESTEGRNKDLGR